MCSKILEMPIPLLLQLFCVLLPPSLLIGINIETLCVAWVSYWRYDRSLTPSVVDVIPINAMEERVIFHVLRAPFQITEALIAVDSAEASDDVFGVLGNIDARVGGETDRFRHDPEVLC